MGRLAGNALPVFGLGRTVVTWAGAALWALGLGTMVLVARAVGAGDDSRVTRTVAQSLVFTLSITILVALACISLATPLLRLITGDAALLSEGVGFLRAYLLAMVTMVMIYLVLSILRGAGESAIAMRLQMVTNVLQGLMVWVFTFGVGPFPKMGVMGVALGVGLARVVGVSSTIWVFLSGRSKVRLSVTDFTRFSPDFGVLKSIIQVSLPNGGESIAKSTSRMIITRLISSTPNRTHAVAAYTVGSQIESLYDMIGSSFSMAAATAVGQNLGADRPDVAAQECHRSAQYGVAISVIMGAVIAWFAPGIMAAFAPAPEAVRTGTILLRWLALASPGYMVMITYGGGLKGAADTRTPMMISVLGSWMVQIPFAYASTSFLGLGTTGIWMSETINYIVQGAIAYSLFRRGDWRRLRI